MKPGWLHLIRLKSGTFHEAALVAATNQITIWRSAWFAEVSNTPRIIALVDIDWAQPVVEATPDLSFADYQDALLQKYK